MAAAKKKQDDKNLAILRELIAQNGNKNCFDCSQRGPTYVNMTIGSFICSKCSGMLRGLTPPHRVKSISMASFTPEEIAQIKSQGNDYCKGIWLVLYEGALPVLKDEQSIKDYMSEKYEKKRYYLDPSFARKQNTVPEKPVTIQNTSPKDNGIWNSTSSKQAITKPSTSTIQLTTAFNPTSSPQLTSNPISTSYQQAPLSCPKFPVDFASADIFNSSQMNNNFVETATQSPMNNFDKKNANTVSHDRYAALADLDFALRQQNQSQSQGEKMTTVNPFEMTTISEISKNPFCINNMAVNGNTHYSNPFAMGPSVTQSGKSKNPFL